MFRGITFTSWLKDNYISRQAMAIRRQVDLDRDVVSLARLIDGVRRYPQALSRSRYAEQTAEWQTREEADWFYDELVGPSLQHIDGNVPRADLAKLRGAPSRIAHWATYELAHYNEAKGTFAVGLTLGDLHGAIGLIVNLAVKYRLLVVGSSMSKVVSMDSWLHVLRKPWIASDDRLMKIHDRVQVVWDKRARGGSLTDTDYLL